MTTGAGRGHGPAGRTRTRHQPAWTTQHAQDGVEDGVQIPADVFGQEAEDEVAVLLQHPVLSTVPSIGGRIRQVLRAIHTLSVSGVRRERNPVGCTRTMCANGRETAWARASTRWRTGPHCIVTMGC